jgi:hypothetical protein
MDSISQIQRALFFTEGYKDISLNPENLDSILYKTKKTIQLLPDKDVDHVYKHLVEQYCIFSPNKRIPRKLKKKIKTLLRKRL